jgi:hypothetical protein
MDSIIIMAAIVAVVVILQLWTIALVFSFKKKVNPVAMGKSNPNPNFDRSERKDQDFRRNSRRPHESPRPQQKPQISGNTPAPASADPVEKSLRDINLRLKNAERDQDVARKRMSESFPRDTRDGREARDGRRDHGRGGRDGNRRDSRPNNRDNRRGNWQDRGDRRDYTPQGPQTESQQSISATPLSDDPSYEVAVKDQLQTPDTGITQSQTPDIAASDLGTSDESLQHGRKVLVKRRMLNEEEQEENSGVGSLNESQPESAQQEADLSDAESSEIRFGRR